MSNIGGKTIILKEKVTVSPEGRTVVIKGPLGEIKLSLPESLESEIKGKELKVKISKENKESKVLQATFSRLITNAMAGVSNGFEKTLEIVGTGFRGQMEGETLVLFVGFSHPVKFQPPAGVKISLQENKIKISGVDKQKVGMVADKIRRLKKPDPYKGKGIRYSGEKLRLKPGKIAAKAISTGGK